MIFLEEFVRLKINTNARFGSTTGSQKISMSVCYQGLAVARLKKKFRPRFKQ